MGRKSLFAILLTVCLLFACCEGKGEINKSDYCFSYQDITFAVGDDTDKTVMLLGEANRISRAPSCAGEGDDELYIYNGFRILSHRDGRGARIYAIELSNDACATTEGVRIGDSVGKVKEIYGNGDDKGTRIEYAGERCRLVFYLQNGKVYMIKYVENGV